MRGDTRKDDIETAVKAIAHLNRLHTTRTSLKIIGDYDDGSKQDLLHLHRTVEGNLLEFYSTVSDEKRFRLLNGSLALIAPYAEGFSSPIAESSVCACPAIAPKCPANMELIDDAEALFPADDSVALSVRLQALLDSPQLRASLIKRQSHLALNSVKMQ